MTGYAIRSRREIDLRDPADEFPVTRVELELNFARRISHPGPLAEKWKSNIIAVRRFQVEFDRLADPRKPGSEAEIVNLRRRVERHLDRTGGLPYDAALATMLGKLDALKQGRLAPRNGFRD